MPPPPPPSASYLLKFDSTDDESSYDDAEIVAPNPHVKKFEREESPVGIQRIPLTEDSGDTSDDEDLSPALVTVSKSKRRKKKRKKKKKKNKKTTTSPKAVVAFGTVTIQEFERALGTDVVPLDGCWPLGLGKAMESPTSTSVEDYESLKQKRLQERHKNMNQISRELPYPLETRQWDYLHSAKNPLFRMVGEHERINLLLGLDGSNAPSAETKPTPSESKKSSGLMRRRSSRVADCSSRKTSAPLYNDVFTKTDVMHSRNELEKIRSSRAMATGCTCRKLNVYLLPPNAGKKAHHRRMNLPKVKDELRKRHLLPENSQEQSRDELELLLHDAVENEPCCAYDCPCWTSGIGCQADSCNCWRHNDKEHNKISVKEIQSSCGNPQGMYAVDLTKIDQWRFSALKNLRECPDALYTSASSLESLVTCQPVL